MALNSSGPISLAGTTAGVSIEIENGGNGTTQISLNDTAVRTLAGVTTPGSTIIMPTNFYGKANAFNYTISANQTNLCMRAGAVTAGWNQTLSLIVTINAGVKVSSNSTGTPALTIAGAFPGGVSLINNGVVVAQGGCGGGGGGGGGGKGVDCCGYYAAGSGGGGGRTGLTNSSGGPHGYASAPSPYPGSAGTYCAAGPGGPANVSFGATGAAGGPGGCWGATGSAGGGGRASGGGNGGAGGKATCGAGPYITWVTTGTRNGSIS